MHKKLIRAAAQQGVTLQDKTIWLVIFGILLPIMGVNVVSLAILQSDLNRIWAKEDAETNGLAG